MVKPTGIEETIAKLNKMAREPITSEGVEFLKKILLGRNSVVIARAAQVISRAGDSRFSAELCAAFDYFLAHPDKDKGCWAKNAIARALDDLGHMDPDVFLRGIRHVQMEYAFGTGDPATGKPPMVDVAGNLRGYCANALTRMLYPEVHFVLLPLLMDKTIEARRAAVGALSVMGCERSELLLRMKVMIGDEDADIIGACFSGLLAMETRRSVPFVAGYLGAEDRNIVGQAAAALGQSEDNPAFEALRGTWESNTDFSLAKTLLLGIGLTRREEAFQLLLEVLKDGGQNNALAAMEALDIYAADPNRRQAIQEAVQSRKDKEVFKERSHHSV
jgi:hypothetical protein